MEVGEGRCKGGEREVEGGAREVFEGAGKCSRVQEGVGRCSRVQRCFDFFWEVLRFFFGGAQIVF